MYKYNGIKSNILDNLSQVESYLSDVSGLIVAYLVGSYARKQEDGISDIDIALLFDWDISSEQMQNLELLIKINCNMALIF